AAAQEYGVRPRLSEHYRSNASVLSALTVPGANGSLVKLANVTTLGAGTSPGQIERDAQDRSTPIISNLYEKPLGEAFKEAFAAVAAERMTPVYGIQTS